MEDFLGPQKILSPYGYIATMKQSFCGLSTALWVFQNYDIVTKSQA